MSIHRLGQSVNPQQTQNNANFISNPREKPATRGGQRGAMYYLPVTFTYSGPHPLCRPTPVGVTAEGKGRPRLNQSSLLRNTVYSIFDLLSIIAYMFVIRAPANPAKKRGPSAIFFMTLDSIDGELRGIDVTSAGVYVNA